jgi:imidazoleglycerol-phosphate dehydratase / histidinol-phosphatase
MKKLLFLDRDGTILIEPSDNFQIDSIEKFNFLPGVVSALKTIVTELDYHLVLVTNQDGLGTTSHPENLFWPFQDLMIRILKDEGIHFHDVHIDTSFEDAPSPDRKPAIGMVKKYMTPDWNLAESYVIGDRDTDVILAHNLRTRSIKIGATNTAATLSVQTWESIVEHLKSQNAGTAHLERTTGETKVTTTVTLYGKGISTINTGIGFLDHMLTLFSFHSGIDLAISIKGDLHIDEHHSVEDAGLTLGSAIKLAVGTKRGIFRYGHFNLPMDETLAQVALDLSGRPCLVFKDSFKRDRVGDLPTELVKHFFESLATTAGITLHMSVHGENDHHQIEALFKAFGRSMRMALTKTNSENIPSTKGVL